jgi:hypothetical protein
MSTTTSDSASVEGVADPTSVAPRQAVAGGPEPVVVPAAEPNRPTRWWRAVRAPVAVFAKVGVLLYAVSWFSIEFLDRHATYAQGPAAFRGTAFLEGWFRWDGNWYRSIVVDGYSFTPGRQSSIAFFPAYPIAIKVANVVFRDVIFTAIVLSLVCGLATAIFFYRWCSRRTSPETARLAVVVLLVYPYAYYLFGAVYADALFLAAAVGAFVLLERGHPVLAGFAGAVATAARPVGLGVLVGLVAVLLEQRGVIRLAIVERIRADGWRAWRRSPVAGDEPDATADASEKTFNLRRLRPADAGVLLAGGGLAAWCLYLWRVWGGPFLFAETEGAPGWDQAAGLHTWLKLDWFDHLSKSWTWLHDSIWRLDVRGYSPWSQFLYTVGIVFQALLVVGALALVPRILRRLGWGYALYVVFVVGIPLIGSKDFQGSGRYMLAAFPCYLIVAEWLAPRVRSRQVWTVISLVLLVFFTSLFARGYYVA